MTTTDSVALRSNCSNAHSDDIQCTFSFKSKCKCTAGTTFSSIFSTTFTQSSNVVFSSTFKMTNDLYFSTPPADPEFLVNVGQDFAFVYKEYDLRTTRVSYVYLGS